MGARDPPDHRRRRPEAWRVWPASAKSTRRERPGRSSGAHALSSRTGASPARHKSTSRTTSRNRRPKLEGEMAPAAAATLPPIVISLNQKINVVLKSDACSVEQVFFSFVMLKQHLHIGTQNIRVKYFLEATIS